MTATETRIPFRPLSERSPTFGNDPNRRSVPARKPQIVNEVHPGTSIPRRDERIRSVGSSFEEIRESSEEAELDETPATSQSARSPYAMPIIDLAFRRSLSLLHQQSMSPRGTRRLGAGCLQRGLSEPMLPRRKSSFGEYSSSLGVDTLSLAPIPESVTPSSPNTQTDVFKQDKEPGKC
ncbi:unnamed protein product, partial [Mesorhabditis spiculigera]